MLTLHLPTGIRWAFTLAVVATLLIHAPEAAALLLAVAGAWWAYRAASTIWHLALAWFWRFTPVTTLATIFVIAMLGHVDVDLGYATAGNMTTAAVAH